MSLNRGWFVPLFVGLIAIAVILLLSYVARGRKQITDARHPEGYYLSLGVSFGLMFGSAIGAVLQMLLGGTFSFVAIGPAMGLPIGAGIGQALESRHRDELRPLTPDEKRRNDTVLWAALGLTALGLALTLLIVFLR